MLVLMYFKLITLGEFFSLMFYSFAIFSPLGEIGTIITSYQETRASLENVERILAQEPAPVNPDGVLPAPVESVEFEGVTYRHPSAREPALEDVSFAVRSGESIAFVGPSGAGKSTLVKLLLGLYQPDAGRILVNGIDSPRLNYDGLRRRVGLRAPVHRALRRHHPRQPALRAPGGDGRGVPRASRRRSSRASSRGAARAWTRASARAA